MRRFIRDYFSHHVQASVNSLGQLSHSPFISLLTCFVIGISLAFPAALFILLKNAENISQHFQQTTQLTLYLEKNITETQALNFTKKIQQDFNIQSISAISPQQGLKELQQQQGFDGVINALPDNPLPWAIVILPNENDPSSLENLSRDLKQLPEVDSLQLDMTWVKRLETLIQLAHRAIYALAIFLGAAVLLIINNAIRSVTQQHQKEIHLVKLLGGTYSFIRRPFLYAGIIYGLLGAIIAWQLVDIFLWILEKPVHRLAESYASSYQLIGMNFNDTAILLGIAMALGWLGAWSAVSRFLR